MKEAFSETMIATNYGITQESVEIVQAPVDADTEMFRLMQYCPSSFPDCLGILFFTYKETDCFRRLVRAAGSPGSLYRNK